MGLTKKEREELRRSHTVELYSYMREIGGSGTVVGLDEVGRGALAGPLTVAAVVLDDDPLIVGLDDSKKLSPKRRQLLAAKIHETARAVSITHIPADEIDLMGMSASLRTAFSRALIGIECEPCAVLIDGNPLHIHPLEQNIVKGDARVACIAAASIVAKVCRDALMVDYADKYPGFGFASNKGYGSAFHIAAIQRLGACELHRKSFLGKIITTQQALL